MSLQDFNQPGRASVVIDGQFGSTGKGLIAAYLALQSPPDIAVTNASANAGHTTVLADGTRFITYHLPTAAVVIPSCSAYLDAGAIINPDMLAEELERLKFDPDRLSIHPNAVVITPDCIAEERDSSSSQTKIGSTQKGVGAALARKVRRSGTVAKDHPYLRQFVERLNLNKILAKGNRSVMIEVPQGHSLSNASPFYPHCTSRQISVAQAMADAELHPSWLLNTLMSIRTFPIRVGNIYDPDTEREIGNSGGWYHDQDEISWQDIGQPAEITTVTKRPRRIATFSASQYEAAYTELQPTHVFLNFCNYLKSADELETILNKMRAVHANWGDMPDILFGHGPSVTQITDYPSIHNMFKNGAFS